MAHILVTIDRIINRRSNLRVTVLGTGIVPVIALPAFHVGAQIVEVVRTARDLRVQMKPVAPIGKWKIGVDADSIDVPICPERIEVKTNITVVLNTKIFRPVCGVGYLGLHADNRPNVGGKAS